MKRRKIDPETKMAAVLEGLRGESSIADICRKYQISESLYYRWRDKFLEGGSQALSSGESSLILHKNGLKNVSTLGEHYTRDLRVSSFLSLSTLFILLFKYPLITKKGRKSPPSDPL